jgi:hypothetical protein
MGSFAFVHFFIAFRRDETYNASNPPRRMEEAVKPRTVSIVAAFVAAAASLLIFGCQGGGKVVNSPPSQVTLKQSKPYIWTSGRVSFIANAVDEDGDPLTFTWKATRGTFDPPSATGSAVTWIAPVTPGSARITMSVTDDIATVSKTADVSVCLPLPDITGKVTVHNVDAYYIVQTQGMLTIQTGDVLTIDPGVTIIFDNGYGGFAVNGSLVAEGTASRHIRFMGNTTTGGSGLWNGISASGRGASIRCKHVELSNADNGLVAMSQAAMSLDSCIIFDNATTGVWASELATLAMTGTTVQQCDEGVYARSAIVEISHCDIVSSGGTGLEMTSGADSIVMTVDHSTIANNRGDEILLSSFARPEIHYCSIFDTSPVAGSYSMRLDSYMSSDSVHAELNYWGLGFDEAKIKSVICDKGKANCASNAYVRFAPWLTSAPVAAR